MWIADATLVGGGMMDTRRVHVRRLNAKTRDADSAMSIFIPYHSSTVPPPILEYQYTKERLS
jgi:hypothetical protein